MTLRYMLQTLTAFVVVDSPVCDDTLLILKAMYKPGVTVPNTVGKIWDLSAFGQKLERFSAQQRF